MTCIHDIRPYNIINWSTRREQGNVTPTQFKSHKDWLWNLYMKKDVCPAKKLIIFQLRFQVGELPPWDPSRNPSNLGPSRTPGKLWWSQLLPSEKESSLPIHHFSWAMSVEPAVYVYTNFSLSSRNVPPLNASRNQASLSEWNGKNLEFNFTQEYQ